MRSWASRLRQQLFKVSFEPKRTQHTTSISFNISTRTVEAFASSLCDAVRKRNMETEESKKRQQKILPPKTPYQSLGRQETHRRLISSTRMCAHTHSHTHTHTCEWGLPLRRITTIREESRAVILGLAACVRVCVSSKAWVDMLAWCVTMYTRTHMTAS